MGVDPISAIFAVVLVVGLIKRIPAIVDMLRDGEDSAAYQAMLRRLRNAGVNPADRGGPLRRALSNAWRDSWASRNAGRGDQAGGEPQGRFAAADAAFGQRWRTTAAAGTTFGARTAGAVGGGTPGPAVGATPAPTPRPTEPGGAAGSTTPPPPPQEDAAVDAPREPIRVGEAIVHRPLPQPPAPGAYVLAAGAAATAVLDRRPVEAPHHQSTSPDNDTKQAAIEGAPMSGTVSPTEITGVFSGQAAALMIARRVEDVVAAFIHGMRGVRVDISILGDQTITNVQMAGMSDVVKWLEQAAEAAAVAEGAARRCGTEVAPLLSRAAASFGRLQS